MQQTVFVIDDDEAVASSLTFLLRAEGLVSRSFSNARAFLDQLDKAQTGCIVTDVRMPGMDGIALVDALAEIGCPMPIIMITGHADVALAVRAMKAGVSDFIEKPFESEAMLAAVRRALENADRRGNQEALRTAILRRQDLLTLRERAVMTRVADGLSSKQIAAELGISYRTVEIYRASVMSKMRAQSLPELVRMVLLISAA